MHCRYLVFFCFVYILNFEKLHVSVQCDGWGYLGRLRFRFLLTLSSPSLYLPIVVGGVAEVLVVLRP